MGYLICGCYNTFVVSFQVRLDFLIIGVSFVGAGICNVCESVIRSVSQFIEIQTILFTHTHTHRQTHTYTQTHTQYLQKLALYILYYMVYIILLTASCSLQIDWEWL